MRHADFVVLKEVGGGRSASSCYILHLVGVLFIVALGFPFVVVAAGGAAVVVVVVAASNNTKS